MATIESTAKPIHRTCDNKNCDISKLVPSVAKRKTPQFITSPRINEKPLLIKGLTTVFQIDGLAANLYDLKSQADRGEESVSAIYRIKPNTHAHIINYIVVDENSEAMRKISEGDIETMRILLESQRGSAEAKLKKLISNHIVAAANAAANAATTLATNNTSASTSAKTNLYSNATAAPVTTAASGLHHSPPFSNIQMHPNLKITSVASAGGVVPMHHPITMPLITPVPLSSLQKIATPSVTQQPPPLQPLTTPSGQLNNETPLIKKLNEELRELQRKIERLSEGHKS